MAGILLVSDLDGTLLGDDRALAKFSRWIESRRDWVRLVYASGRFFDSICESIRTTHLPEPDAVIGGVGTQMRRFPTGERIGEWLQWPPDNWSAGAIRRALQDLPGLTPQSEELLSEFKLSYHLYDATEEQIAEVRERLGRLVGPCQVVYSSRRDLDVLPEGIDKGSAAAYLARHWKLPNEQVIVAGDSGNDLSLFGHGFRGIVVANAQRELVDLAPPEAYRADEPYAAGVLAGLEHWLEALAPAAVGSHATE